MNLHISPAPVRKSIVVKAGIDKAFAVFTESMGRWWPKSHSINRATEQVAVVLEPKPQGRWYERGADGSECQWGHVLAWEPPGRVLLAWQIGADWKYDPSFLTEVEIRFTAEGAQATRIDLEHRNLERFGEKAAESRAAFDSEGGWTGILKVYAEIAAA
ncbi:MAG: SRPBCC family protein [Pseudomonadota bacterium]